MSQSQPFHFITRAEEKQTQLFDEYQELTSAHISQTTVQILSKLRGQHPELIITTVPAYNCNLTQFALAGQASIELDIDTEKIVRYRGYVPATKRGNSGALGDAVSFAKFRYVWEGNAFILYTVGAGISGTQFILSEPRDDETPLGNSAVTDALLTAIGDAASSDKDVVYVYDGVWQKSRDLWKEVQKSSWDNVILDPNTKKELVEVANKFFDSEDVYKQFGVPWKVVEPGILHQFKADTRLIAWIDLLWTSRYFSPFLAPYAVSSRPHLSVPVSSNELTYNRQWQDYQCQNAHAHP